MTAGGGLDRPGNVLGALSLAVTDRTSAAVGHAAGQSESAAITLSALHHILDGPSMDLLRRVLGLTPSGAVRLVDRLEASGLVTRRPGSDGRSVSIHLTAAGRGAARRVSAARGRVLEDALSVLTPDERDEFDGMLSRVLRGLVRGSDSGRLTCRLCDTTACGRAEGRCPVADRSLKRPG